MHTVAMRTPDMLPTTGITLPLAMELKPGTKFALRFSDGRQGTMRVTGKPKADRYPMAYEDFGSGTGSRFDLALAALLVLLGCALFFYLTHALVAAI